MKKGRKKLDSFLRLFCVGIACVSILAVGTFALVGSNLFDGVVKSRTENSTPAGGNDFIETGKDENGNGGKDDQILNPSKPGEDKPSEGGQGDGGDQKPSGGDGQGDGGDQKPSGGDGQGDGGDQKPSGGDGGQGDGSDQKPSGDDQKKDFDFKFVDKDGKTYVEEIGDLAVDENGKVQLPSTTPDGKEVSGVVSGAGDNKNIKEINIPEGYTDIEEGAFSGADNVTKIVIESKEAYDSLDEDLFGIGGDKRKDVEIFVNSTVDDGTNSMLEDEDFYIEEDINKVSEDGSITTTYKRYYYNTTDFRIRKKTILGFTTEGAKKNLTEITLGSESLGVPVMGVGKNAFRDNKNLTKVTLENDMLYFSEGSFFGCTNITEFDISTRISWVRANEFSFSGIIQLVPVDPNVIYYDNLTGERTKGSDVADNQVLIGDINDVNVLKLYVKDIEAFYNTAVKNGAITCPPGSSMLLDLENMDYNGEKRSLVIKDATCYFHREEFVSLPQDKILETFVNNDKFSYGSLDYEDTIYTTTEDGGKRINSLVVIKFGAMVFNREYGFIITIPADVDAVSVDAITEFAKIDEVIFEDLDASWTVVLADGTVTTVKFTSDANQNAEILNSLKAGTDIVKVK